ncbi:MAG: GTPase RsgA, partial [Bacteroidales bacterium]|nr:GTPase RsgA [Bacteroidales bacterium]
MIQGEATVVKNAGSHYLLSALPLWEVFPATLRGKIRLKASEITNPIAVGDRVRYCIEDDGSATITEILPRDNYVIRRSTNLSRQAHIIAANVDRAYLIVSLYFPEVKLPFLDRILVTCGLYGIPATIVLSKVDMYRDEAPEAVAAFKAIYRSAGYPVLETSVRTG